MKYTTTHYNNKSIDYWHREPDTDRQQMDQEYCCAYFDEESEVQLAKQLSRISLLDETPDDFRREVEYRQMIANAA